MLVLYVVILLLPPAGVSSMILRSILHSISEQGVLVLYILILLLPPAGVISIILLSILSSISETRGGSFVCFNTSAVSSWGQHYDSA